MARRVEASPFLLLFSFAVLLLAGNQFTVGLLILPRNLAWVSEEMPPLMRSFYFSLFEQTSMWKFDVRKKICLV